MNPTRRPHTVPASYLKFWDRDRDHSRGRDSIIYINDGTKCRFDKVSNISIRRKYYSTVNPNAAESFFSVIEDDYARFVNTIITTGTVPKGLAATLSLINFIISLLARNPTFEHKFKTDERIENVKIAQKEWRRHFLFDLGSKGENVDYRAVNELWGLMIVGTPTADFVTSDNPVAVITISELKYDMYILPVSPNYVGLVYKKAKIKNPKDFTFAEATVRDIERLNSLQAMNANRENYANTVFSDEEIASLAKLKAKTASRDNFIDEKLMRLEPFQIPDKPDFFSFISVK